MGDSGNGREWKCGNVRNVGVSGTMAAVSLLLAFPFSFATALTALALVLIFIALGLIALLLIREGGVTMLALDS